MKQSFDFSEVFCGTPETVNESAFLIPKNVDILKECFFITQGCAVQCSFSPFDTLTPAFVLRLSLELLIVYLRRAQ